MEMPANTGEEATDTMPDDQADQSGSSGVSICIDCLPDGTFKVSTESLEQEAQEEQGATGSEAGQDANSIGEALKLAMQAFKDWQSESGGSEGDAMAAGFQSVRGA